MTEIEASHYSGFIDLPENIRAQLRRVDEIVHGVLVPGLTDGTPETLDNKMYVAAQDVTQIPADGFSTPMLLKQMVDKAAQAGAAQKVAKAASSRISIRTIGPKEAEELHRVFFRIQMRETYGRILRDSERFPDPKARETITGYLEIEESLKPPQKNFTHSS